MNNLRLVFIGGTKRALITLEMVLQRQDVEVVYAIFMKGLPDEHQYADQLATLATSHQISHIVSDTVDSEITSIVKGLNPDLIFGGGIWRSLLKKDFFDIPKYGYLSLHGTALPEYRGMAGINWQIIHGCDSLKMRMFRLGEGIDDGDLIGDAEGNILEYTVPIDNQKHLQEIFDDYDQQHLLAANDLFDLALKGEITFHKQDESEATYSCHRGEADAEIDWNKNSVEIFNLIRSQAPPYAGAFTFYNGKMVRIFRARVLEDYTRFVGRISGKVVERERFKSTVAILSADSALEILEAESGGEKDVRKIFNSVRKKCQSKIEAVTDILSTKYGLFE